MTPTSPLENQFDPDVGFDAKYGVTKGLIADFTVNTDFAQVEADDQQVNLTRFSLFFPEKREFFLEGQGLFAFGGNSGRRGGGGGGGGRRHAHHVLQPPQLVSTTAFRCRSRRGARMTGRQGRYTLGILNMQTKPVDSAGTRRDELLGSPREAGHPPPECHRRHRDPPQQHGRLRRLELAVRRRRGLHVLREPEHQRVLRGEPDPGARRATRRATRRASITGGDRYGFNLSHLKVGDDFNPDVGFVRRDDIKKTSGRLRFSPRPRSIAAVRKFSVLRGLRLLREPPRRGRDPPGRSSSFRTELNNGDNFEVSYTQNFEYLFDDFEISDGVTLHRRRVRLSTGFGRNYRMGPQRKITGWINASTGQLLQRHPETRWATSAASSSVRSSPSSRTSRRTGSTSEEGSFTTTLLLRLRSTYTLSSRSFIGALVQYNTSNSSLSTNIRYRWEYQPGSDLFVVYTDGREHLARSEPVGAPQPELRGQVHEGCSDSERHDASRGHAPSDGSPGRGW